MPGACSSAMRANAAPVHTAIPPHRLGFRRGSTRSVSAGSISILTPPPAVSVPPTIPSRAEYSREGRLAAGQLRRGLGRITRVGQHPVHPAQPDRPVRATGPGRPRGEPGADELARPGPGQPQRGGQRLVAHIVAEDHDALGAELVPGAAAGPDPRPVVFLL